MRAPLNADPRSDNPAASLLEYGSSPLIAIYQNPSTLSPHKTAVYQPWISQPVPLQPLYDESVTSFAFFPTMSQIRSVDPTIIARNPSEKHPSLLSDQEVLPMSNIVTTFDPIPNIFTTNPFLQPLRRCGTILEFLKCMYDVLEGERTVLFLAFGSTDV